MNLKILGKNLFFRISYFYFGEVRCGDTIVRLFSKRERTVLRELEEIRANSLVEKISRKYNIPKSTVWYILKKFRKIGLIHYENGSKIRMSKLSKILREILKKNWFEVS